MPESDFRTVAVAHIQFGPEYAVEAARRWREAHPCRWLRLIIFTLPVSMPLAMAITNGFLDDKPGVASGFRIDSTIVISLLGGATVAALSSPIGLDWQLRRKFREQGLRESPLNITVTGTGMLSQTPDAQTDSDWRSTTAAIEFATGFLILQDHGYIWIPARSLENCDQIGALKELLRCRLNNYRVIQPVSSTAQSAPIELERSIPTEHSLWDEGQSNRSVVAQLQIDLHYLSEAVRRARQQDWNRTLLWMSFSIFTALVTLVFLAAMIREAINGSHGAVDFAIATAVTAIGFPAMACLFVRLERQATVSKLKKRPTGRAHFKFADLGFECDTPDANFQRAWTGVLKAVEMPDGYLIFLDRENCLWIPDTALKNPADVLSLRELLNSRIPKYRVHRPLQMLSSAEIPPRP